MNLSHSQYNLECEDKDQELERLKANTFSLGSYISTQNTLRGRAIGLYSTPAAEVQRKAGTE